ncbi:MAG: hypothetical protein PUI64_04595 [Treponema succinifaciens]|uniref:hypothetical protein n=1 Tax=Treponema succinifaciens TaxID=167 RepID=UPI0023F01EDD|nr:hypothetical protein [Treponema succinifaciens]MDD6962164.1 hypothetical protein [Treponema succinifaciens]MDY5116883.1 hypothetical protein [Treponema succinifaciens]
MLCCKTPSVGIWWFYYGEVLFADSVAVENGLPYGECITGLSDHAEFWKQLLKNGELDKIPQNLQSEYFYIPRGRVVFHKDTGRFTILHGGLKKRELNKIRKFFCLQKELTDFDTDFHYKII